MGEAAANLWTPKGVPFGEWTRFVSASVPILAAVMLVLFVVYLSGYYRNLRLKSVNDVFQQDRPWVMTFWGVLVFHVIACLGAGLIVVSVRSFESILGMILIGAVEGAFGMLAYWVISLLLSVLRALPARVKYIPYLAHMRVRRLPPPVR